MARKYKIGDVVKVRDDLKVGEFYDHVPFTVNMERFLGRELAIGYTDRMTGNYILKEGDGVVVWQWSDEMFVGLASDQQRVEIIPQSNQDFMKMLFGES